MNGQAETEEFLTVEGLSILAGRPGGEQVLTSGTTFRLGRGEDRKSVV